MTPAFTDFSAAPTPLAVAAETLASGGAILTVGFPERRHLVGHLAWLGPRRLFWFTAHGDAVEDGHVLEFDEVDFVSKDWISFQREGKRVASLATIGAAGVEDPDDYLIAWQLWHEVAPRRTALIHTCLRHFAGRDVETAAAVEPLPAAARRRASTPHARSA